MKQAKEIERIYFHIVAVDEDMVFFDTGEEQWEMPKDRFTRMFGRDNLHEGQIGTLVIKQRADRSISFRAWPYKRKWTKEEIDAANAQAEALFVNWE